MSNAEMNAAIRDCLAHFESGVSPIAQMAGYLDRLHADPRWHSNEIYEFESRIRHIIRELVTVGVRDE